MKVKKIDKDKALVEIKLEDVRCPYCGNVIEPKSEPKVCENCKKIRYQLVDTQEKERNCYTYPVIFGKKPELECISTGKYVLFCIEKPLPSLLTLTIDEEVAHLATSKNFKRFLEHLDDILQKGEFYQKRGRKTKKATIYSKNIDFNKQLKLLKLKDERILSNVFSQFLKNYVRR